MGLEQDLANELELPTSGFMIFGAPALATCAAPECNGEVVGNHGFWGAIRKRLSQKCLKAKGPSEKTTSPKFSSWLTRWRTLSAEILHSLVRICVRLGEPKINPVISLARSFSSESHRQARSRAPGIQLAMRGVL